MSLTVAPGAAGVVVIGAGPAGSAAAAHLGAAGVDVLVLERTSDSGARTGAAVLTPAAVRELHALGLTEDDTAGWHRTTGVRFVGGGMRLALAWPDVDGRPAHGLVTSRSVLEDTLVSYAVRSGARVRRGVEVTGVTRDASGRVDGVSTTDGTVPAAVVIDASGAAATPAGRAPRGGVAVSADFESPRHVDDHVESWLSLATGDGARLPGHGWIVGRGDGRVTVGVGALAEDTTATTDACAGVLQQWLTALPASWRLTESSMTGPISGARVGSRPSAPSHDDTVLAVGDAAGVANPLTGEGLAAALASGRLAAATVAREGELTAYDAALSRALGRHRTVGRAAARLVDSPRVSRLVTTYALPRERLMRSVLARVTTPTPAAVETCVTTSTMGPVTRAAAHPGTERGVDQR